MDLWTYAFTFEAFILDFSVVSALLVVGTLCRRYIPFLQRFLIPNNLTAGFIGLLIGPEVLELVNLSLDRMGVYVYHLLALTFISVGLQRRPTQRSRAAVNLGFIQTASILLQALVGLSIALIVVYLLNPDLVPAVGMLLPLGFAMGPGTAYAIGHGWDAYGFGGAGSIGLTFGAIGFLIAYITGMLVVNRGIRRSEAVLVSQKDLLSQDVRTGIITEEEPKSGARLTFFSGAIDSLSFHFALIGSIYLLTYWVTKGLAYLFVLGGIASEVPTLWSFHFLIANLLALLVRRLLDASPLNLSLDEGFLNRSTGFLADYLIAASIMGISLVIAWTYIIPIVLMAIIGAFVTFISIRWVAKRVFEDYPFERAVGIYGQMTGNLSSGLALIRVTDPSLRTSIAQDQALSTGIALVLAFPLFAVINLPFTAFEGQLEGYWAALGIFFAYLLIILFAWKRFSRKAHG